MTVPTPDPNLDLSFTRDVPLPPEAIWTAWTVPEHLLPWFCPKPWQTVECGIELRPGGKFYTVMRSPEGETFPGTGCYLEVIPNRRLVWTNALLPGFRPAPVEAGEGSCGDFHFTAIVELEPIATGTRYTATVKHRDAAGRAQHEGMGFEAGWGAALAQLVEYMQAKSG
ncbi:SRPBCC family protein [Jeongeupia chitinilytica]|uniref:Activator of HSP90 ATPase n=1 Tax=Jeongeupia chitinilytica TaxID=1041641 RepID=A0ABQ3H2Y4_9NEIS|nr:SRPBCC family protein [Jeongeupia chitinilytica]GHD62345.1 activator of HSP90 ATPase [Jeongeupia chitinilytica]